MPDLAWNAVGLAVNIPGVIDVCIQFGDHIITKISVYRNAHVHANEIAYRFDTMWKNIVDIIRAIRKIQDKLAPDMKYEISRTLNRLRDTLGEAINTASRSGVQLGYNPRPGEALLLSAVQKKKLEKLVNYAQIWHDEMLKRLLVIGFTSPDLLSAVTRFLQPGPIPQNH